MAQTHIFHDVAVEVCPVIVQIDKVVALATQVVEGAKRASYTSVTTRASAVVVPALQPAAVAARALVIHEVLCRLSVWDILVKARQLRLCTRKRC